MAVTKRQVVTPVAASAVALAVGLSANAGPSNAQFAALQRQVTAQATQIAKLNAAVFPTASAAPLPTATPVLITVGPPPTPTITLGPPPTATTGKVVQFPAGGTPAQLTSLMADLSTDVVEIASGTYSRWSAFVNVARPANRPLLVRPAPGAAVVWDGGGGGEPAFRIGWSSLASYITFDPAGTGGSFRIQNYRIGAAGLVMARWFDHVTFNGVIVRDSTGTGTPQTSHALYLDSDGVHRGQYWTSNGWDVVGPTNRVLNGLHIYHAPNADHVEATGWTVSNLHRWAYVYSGATDVRITGWVGSDSDATIDTDGTATGLVSGCRATSSGTLAPGKGYWNGSRLLAGSGNVAA